MQDGRFPPVGGRCGEIHHNTRHEEKIISPLCVCVFVSVCVSTVQLPGRHKEMRRADGIGVSPVCVLPLWAEVARVSPACIELHSHVEAPAPFGSYCREPDIKQRNCSCFKALPAAGFARG